MSFITLWMYGIGCMLIGYVIRGFEKNRSLADDTEIIDGDPDFEADPVVDYGLRTGNTLDVKG